MTFKELLQTQKLELTQEHQKLVRTINDTKEKLLKTEGALLMIQHLEKLTEEGK
jgi:hypothetical protein